MSTIKNPIATSILFTSFLICLTLLITGVNYLIYLFIAWLSKSPDIRDWHIIWQVIGAYYIVQAIAGYGTIIYCFFEGIYTTIKNS